MNQYIGKELRSIRNYRSLTLRELGEKTGIPYSRLGKFECGKEMPTDETILKIGKILNVDFNKYFNISKEIDVLFNEFLDSLFYHDQSIDLFKAKISRGREESDVNYVFGKVQLIEYIISVLNHEFDKARSMESELFEYFKEDYECKALLYQYKAIIFQDEKHFAEAIPYFEKAESLMINRKSKAMLFLHSSVAYKNVGNVAKSMRCIEMAHHIFAEYGSLRRVAFCFVEYGLLLKANYQFEKAITQFNIALRSLEMIECPESLFAKVYRNMCWTMILAKDYKAALEYLDEAIEIEPKHGFTVLYAIWCNYKLENYEEAERRINENTHLKSNERFGSFYEMFDLMVKCQDGIPSIKLINAAAQIIENFMNGEDYERINFYLDIILDLLNRSGREMDKIKYLEMKVNLTKKR